jgi:MarR family 2-MHQ and catechol resistance regulon transcriptional repressor
MKVALVAPVSPPAPVSASQARALKLWVVLARAYAAVERRVAEDIARHDLTVMEFGILEVLHHKGPLLLGEIQKKVLVTSGGITYLVDRLEGKGLVTREACPTDRRARYAVLTAAGQSLIARIFPEHASMIAQVMAPLGAREQQDVIAILRRLGLATVGSAQP